MTLPVFVFVHDLRSSGVVRNAITIANALTEHFDTTLLAGYGNGLFAEEARAARFRLEVLGQGAPGNGGRLAAAVNLRRYVAARPGLLVSGGNFSHPAFYLATRGLPHLRHYWISNDFLRGRASDPVRRRWARMLLADGNHLVCGTTGHFAIPGYREAAAAGKVSIVPNGVDCARAAAARSLPPPHPWLQPDEKARVPVVLGVGRLRPQKNFAFLLEAVAALRRKTRARLIILGGGTPEAREELVTLAQRLHLGDDFLLVGETTDPFPFFAHATVFALPSRFEGATLVLREAMAAGVPVVANPDAGDTREVLKDGRFGILAGVDDPEAFATALARQVGSHPVLPGRRGFDFSDAAMAQAYCEVVRRELERQAAG